MYPGSLVFSGADEFGPIDIVDEHTARSMHFGTAARQSTMLRATPSVLALAYTRCMACALLFTEPLRQALLLGLGGGSLARYMLDQHPRCQLQAVELRPRVVELAQRYFALPDDPRLRICTDCAGHFLEQADGPRWDVLFVDLHDPGGLAPVQGRPGFFRRCRQVMAAGGVLAANLWSGPRGRLLEAVERNLRGSFGQVLQLPVAGKHNTVALAFCAPVTRDRWRRAQMRARQWRNSSRIDFTALLQDLARYNPGLD